MIPDVFLYTYKAADGKWRFAFGNGDNGDKVQEPIEVRSGGFRTKAEAVRAMKKAAKAIDAAFDVGR
jgi:hypothetical protein